MALTGTLAEFGSDGTGNSKEHFGQVEASELSAVFPILGFDPGMDQMGKLVTKY